MRASSGRVTAALELRAGELPGPLKGSVLCGASGVRITDSLAVEYRHCATRPHDRPRGREASSFLRTGGCASSITGPANCVVRRSLANHGGSDRTSHLGCRDAGPAGSVAAQIRQGPQQDREAPIIRMTIRLKKTRCREDLAPSAAPLVRTPWVSTGSSTGFSGIAHQRPSLRKLPAPHQSSSTTQSGPIEHRLSGRKSGS